MGASYGSIQVRIADRARVIQALCDVVTGSSRRYLCGPEINGWVGVYPDRAGQDEKDAVALAARLEEEIFWLCVHDDDIFLYRFFRGGKEVDSYHSTPGYFGEEQRPQEALLVGDPRTYASLIGGRVEEASEILRRDRDVDPEAQWGRRGQVGQGRRLEEFVALLGISNAVTSYDYLQDGEREGVVGWKQFIHVPDLAAEKKAAREAEAALKREKTRIQREGLLAGDKVYEGSNSDWATFAFQVAGLPPNAERRGRIGLQVVRHPSGSHDVHRAQSRLLVRPVGEPKASDLIIGDARDGVNVRLGDAVRLLRQASELLLNSSSDVLEKMVCLVPAERRATLESDLRRLWPRVPTESEMVLLTSLVVRAGSFDTFTQHSFTSDGSLLLCGTSLGLRVFAWDDVLAAASDSPPKPRFWFDVPAERLVPNPKHGYTYAAAEDPRGGAIIFAGSDGRIRRLSLSSGAASVLFTPPGSPAVLDMIFLDEERLAMLVAPGFHAINRKRLAVRDKNRVQVWNYRGMSIPAFS